MHSGYEIVRLAADRTPGHLAMADDRSERRLTYGQLMAEIDEVAAGFAARGIGRGTRVATVLPGIWEHCIALLALMRLNAVPALLNFRLGHEELTALCEAGGIEAAVIGPDPELAGRLAGALGDGAPIWSAGGGAGSALAFADCRGDAAALAPYEKPDPEETAFLFYTSGTTGLPKAVVLAHRTTEPRLLWLATQGGLCHGTHNRALGCMPLSHAIGFYGVFLVTLAFNGSYFVVSEFNPAAIVELVARERLTYAFCIPPMFQAMASAPGYAPGKMASIERVFYGGVGIDPELLDRIDREWGGTVRHIYGTTETMCSLYHPDPVGRHARLRPGYYSHVRVARIGGDGPHDTVGAGEEGELIVDATVDTIFSGYLGRPDATAEKLHGGWYRTGDIFLQESDGDLTLVGRVDDMIRSGGESIHPEEVESALESCAAVREAGVVGVPDRRWGQMAVACVVAAAGAAPGEELAREIDRWCRQASLARFKRPRGYVFLEGLPRNAANKVLRRQLRDLAAAARAGEADARFFDPE